MFGDKLKAIKSLKMIKDKVYTFEYRGDYSFKSFLEQGGAKIRFYFSLIFCNFTPINRKCTLHNGRS